LVTKVVLGIKLNMSYTIDMAFSDFKQKDSVIVVYTGDGKG